MVGPCSFYVADQLNAIASVLRTAAPQVCLLHNSMWHSNQPNTLWPHQHLHIQTTILLRYEEPLAGWAMTHVFLLPVSLHRRVQIQNKLFNVWLWASFTHQQPGDAKIKWQT